MEKWTESLEQYLEEGKLPLVGEIFSRKKEIGDKLKLQREESHKIISLISPDVFSSTITVITESSCSFFIAYLFHYILPYFFYT